MRDPSIIEILECFPDEAAATQWLERSVWGERRCCGHCGSTRTKDPSCPVQKILLHQYIER